MNEPETPQRPGAGKPGDILSSWPDGATYTFTREQLANVVDWYQMCARDAAALAAPGAGLDRDVIARFLHAEMFDETPEQALDLDATAYGMADRLIERLGATPDPRPETDPS